jgi:hypothetical protein
VIPLTMSADGRMPVPQRSASRLLDWDRFNAASRLLAVTGST